MKKTLLITIALGASFLLASNAKAQNAPAKNEASTQKSDKKYAALSAQRQTSKLTPVLGLNPEQVQKMKSAFTNYYLNNNKIEEKYQNQKPAPPALKQDRKENLEKLHAEVKTFLTPEQYEKYLKAPGENADRKPAPTPTK